MTTAVLQTSPLFDAHLHIIDPVYPLVPNQGYLPPSFTVKDYLQRMQAYNLIGGAVVSGSFQTFDQSYLIAALAQLGPQFVGVTQLPADTPDKEIEKLHQAGVRAVRFNLKRGGSERVCHLETFAKRVYSLVSWHVELYVDSRDLAELAPTLRRLPAVSIDHLGLSEHGLTNLLPLVGDGIMVKATGFSRGDLDVKNALCRIFAINPQALMFGTDLPSTRAPSPYQDADFLLVYEALGERAKEVLSENALRFYGRR